MADIADIASEDQAVYEGAALKAVLDAASKPIIGASNCLYCGEELVQDAALPKRFCDAHCRDDFEKFGPLDD